MTMSYCSRALRSWKSLKYHQVGTKKSALRHKSTLHIPCHFSQAARTSAASSNLRTSLHSGATRVLKCRWSRSDQMPGSDPSAAGRDEADSTCSSHVDYWGQAPTTIDLGRRVELEYVRVGGPRQGRATSDTRARSRMHSCCRLRSEGPRELSLARGRTHSPLLGMWDRRSRDSPRSMSATSIDYEGENARYHTAWPRWGSHSMHTNHVARRPVLLAPPGRRIQPPFAAPHRRAVATTVLRPIEKPVAGVALAVRSLGTAGSLAGLLI